MESSRGPAALRGAAWVVAVALASGGCSRTPGGGGAGAGDRAATEKAWVLSLDHGGSRVELPLEALDIYLTDDEQYPETFEIQGEGVVIAGEFPPDLRVGYGEDFDRLVGRPIAIDPRSGGDPQDPKSSSITLAGVSTPILGGSFTVERITGSTSGVEGDKTVHGTIELRVGSGGREEVLRGTFAAHAVTWG